MRVLRLVLAALLALAPLSASARAESADPLASGAPSEPPPPLPQGDDPRGGGGLG